MWSPRAGRRRSRIVAALAAVTFTLGALMTAPAQATTNGQQVIVDSGYRFTAAKIQGYNQWGDWVKSPWFGGVNSYWCNSGKRCYFTGLGHWYWKGTVYIEIVDQYTGWRAAATCYVPTYQSHDWTTCRVPR